MTVMAMYLRVIEGSTVTSSKPHPIQEEPFGSTAALRRRATKQRKNPQNWILSEINKAKSSFKEAVRHCWKSEYICFGNSSAVAGL